ncbi:MAG: hypothetical protein KatS3mg108_0307 [Isosphaeraceae bacterium]|jgi:uncharacterized membrane protein YkvA (DUF1232 family)|nr:MAG: hypothetical protein KatS3mg108_0307 [Isosphaeraceae bacterium]
MAWPWNRRPHSRPQPKTDAPTAPDLNSIRPEDWVGTDSARHQRLVRDQFAATARRYLRHIPIAEDVVALYFCLLDPRTPLWAKGVAAAALAYFILPTDALPDLLPLIGLSDDVAILSAALTTLSTQITPEHRARAQAFLRDEHILDTSP